MELFLILIGVIVLAALLYVNYLIAKEFYNAACAKGYENKKYLWISFFLGITGYLLVIALPNRIASKASMSNDLPEL